jgi:3-oxoacyl-[acyl-carrier protein] reductase
MNLDLNGKCALVGGSSQGIGLASARELALLGCRVILMARDEEKLSKAIVTLAPVTSGNHSFLAVDFHQPEQLEQKINELLKNITVNILINNTGGPPGGPAIGAGVDEFRRAFEQHLVCNHILVTHCVPGMKSSGYGRIINVISTSVKQPLPNLGVSNTIRGAVANHSKTLANELGSFGITVNNVLPGATATSRLDEIICEKALKTGRNTEELLAEMASAVPAKRVGLPEEVGAAIAFLASPAAGYINGINLPVDGGRTSTL